MNLLPHTHNNQKTVYMIQVALSTGENYIHQIDEHTQFYSNVLKAENEANRLAELIQGAEFTVVKFDYKIN